MSKRAREIVEEVVTEHKGIRFSNELEYQKFLDSMEAEIDNLVSGAKKEAKQEWLKEKHAHYDCEIAKARQKTREAEFEAQQRKELNGELHERNKRLHDEIKKLQRKAKRANLHFPLGEIKPLVHTFPLEEGEIQFLRKQVERLTSLLEKFAE
jgi:hypothetical protein